MKIDKVQLVFENCEVLDIMFEDILHLHIGETYQKCHRYSNTLSFDTVLKEFAIVLNKDTKGDFWGNVTVEKRLAMRDVTHVILYGSEEISYSLEWNEYDNYYSSTSQHLKYTPKGHFIYTSSTQSLIKIDADEMDDIAYQLWELK